MPTDNKKTYYCEKCKKIMRGDQFYTSNNLEKYPNDGKLNLCKQCLTMHVDNFNPETYLWILEEVDVPYIPKEWKELLRKFGRDKNKLTGTTIVGRYLSKMKLTQWCDYRWKDSEFLQEVERNSLEQAMKRQGYDAQEIAKALQEEDFELPPPEEIPKSIDTSEDYFAKQNNIPEIELDLTDEDKKYLNIKWGRTYKPEEWVWLEQLYEDMMNSYDIQTAGHLDTLKLICKTSLKANQLLDIGD